MAVTHLDLGGGVQAPISMLNRHGLVAGATGTGKTRTMQLLAEQLSAAGVPVLLADVKGDVSGMAQPGDPAGKAAARAQELGLADWSPAGFPVELLALGGIGTGVPVRATLTDFGPQLLAKVLGANQTQEQALQLVFHHADTAGLPLLDLSDLRALLAYLDSDAGKAELKGIGGLSTQTVGVLLRSLVGLETGGGNELFGEPAFDIADLLRTTPDGRGVVSILELAAVQGEPGLWSTAMLWLVAELFETLPEAGDLDRPKVVVFLDEAHLLFRDATKAFKAELEQTVRLIRSKGVGIVFVTQSPKDLPSEVLGQLGAKVQHALRAFTPEDADALRAAVRTFPKTEGMDLEAVLQELAIGEAVVTLLDERGVPSPVRRVVLPPPRSKMAPADDPAALVAASPLAARYGTRVDAQSARELLAGRLAPPPAAPEPEAEPAPEPEPKLERIPAPRPRRRAPAPPPEPDAVGDFLRSRQGKQLQKEVVRGVFSLLRKRL